MYLFKKILKITALTLVTMVLLVALYLLTAYVLSRIPVSPEPVASTDVEIYILTNGVHTDLVAPVKNELVDWSKDLRFENTISKDTTAKFVALGWGDRGVYLDTPTWADLTFSTAFKAAFNLSTSVIHATFHKTMQEGKDCVRILISKPQYARLIQYIRSSFMTDQNGQVIYIPTRANYGKYDAFYQARYSYNIFHTCNTWVNNGLKNCGQKACLWTPFDTGIFLQYTKE